MASRQAYVQKLNAQLKEWDAKLDQLSAKALEGDRRRPHQLRERAGKPQGAAGGGEQQARGTRAAQRERVGGHEGRRRKRLGRDGQGDGKDRGSFQVRRAVVAVLGTLVEAAR